MNARLLASMDTEPFKEVPDLSPQPQLTNPNMPIPVQPGPVGAKYLAEAPALMPRRQAAPTPAAAMAQPAAQAPAPATALSPAELEDRAFRKKINESAQQYRRTIDARRATRSAVGEYHKLKGQLETAAGSLEDLKGLEKDYAGVYAPDSPALMALKCVRPPKWRRPNGSVSRSRGWHSHSTSSTDSRSVQTADSMPPMRRPTGMSSTIKTWGMEPWMRS